MAQKKQKKRFNQQFKDSAVQLVDGGKSAAQVAGELGLQEWQVQSWVRDSRKRKATTGGADQNLLEDLKRLKKENARLHLFRFVHHELDGLRNFSDQWHSVRSPL